MDYKHGLPRQRSSNLISLSSPRLCLLLTFVNTHDRSAMTSAQSRYLTSSHGAAGPLCVSAAFFFLPKFFPPIKTMEDNVPPDREGAGICKYGSERRTRRGPRRAIDIHATLPSVTHKPFSVGRIGMKRIFCSLPSG
jgi:hypothetical protein